MKKTFIVLLLALFAIQANAQEFNFGVKGGLNLANVRGDNADLDMRTAFHLGLVGEYMFNEQLGLQPELLFSSQGAKGKEDGETYKLALNYISIPVMLKCYLAEGFSVHAGPQVGFLVDSKMSEGDLSVNGKDFLEGFDFSLGLGMGYKFNNNLFIEGRYSLGLTDIFDESNENIDLNGNNVKNGVFQFSLGYMF